MKVVWYFMFSFLFFCLEPPVRKKTWMRTVSITVMVISKVLFWKLLDHSYVQSFFSAIMRHTDNDIWKTPHSWRFYGHGSTYVLFLSWANIIQQKSTEVSGKFRKIRAYPSKNIAPRHFTYYCILLFLSNKPSC